MKPALVLLEGVAAGLAAVAGDPEASLILCNALSAGVGRALAVLREELQRERERDAETQRTTLYALSQLEERLIAVETRVGKGKP
jgi:hypothetical protein